MPDCSVHISTATSFVRIRDAHESRVFSMVLGNISEDDAQGGALAFQGGSCELVQRQIVPQMSWGGMWTFVTRWIPSYLKDSDVNTGALQRRCDLLTFTADFVLYKPRLFDINKAVVTPP